MLTETQKEKYLSISGKHYDGFSIQGEFMTEFPYNDREWQYSSWSFRYQIDVKNGILYCEISHRMTNSRMFGWNQDGIEIPFKEVLKVYPNTDPFVEFLIHKSSNDKIKE